MTRNELYKKEKWLRKHYCSHRNISKIARKCNCSTTTIRNWLDRFNIERVMIKKRYFILKRCEDCDKPLRATNKSGICSNCSTKRRSLEHNKIMKSWRGKKEKDGKI